MTPPYVENISRFLRSERISKGISQVEIGKKLGYSSQFVANWERGVSAPPKVVLKPLSKILNVNKSQMIEVILRDYELELKNAFKDQE